MKHNNEFVIIVKSFLKSQVFPNYGLYVFFGV